MARLLLVEDEAVLGEELQRLFERHGHSVVHVTTVARALEAHPASFDLVLSDLRLPDGEGTALIKSAEGAPVVIMTSYGSVASAVQAMKDGAVDYVSKPFEPDEVMLVIDRHLEGALLKRRQAALSAEVDRAFPTDGMVGNCEPMRQVFDRIPQDRTDRRDGAGAGRIGYRQRAGRPRAARPEQTRRGCLRGGQLRGDTRHPHRV